MEELLYAYNKMTKAALNALRRASCFLKKKKKVLLLLNQLTNIILNLVRKFLLIKVAHS